MAGRHLGAIVLLGLGLPGCYDGFDPLDPEVLAEIARSRGDAQGIELTGIYVGTYEALECGCADLMSADQLSLCMLVELAQQFDQDQYFPMTVVQADGTVRIQPLPENQSLTNVGSLAPTLYGPLDVDGHITAAGVLQADGIVARGQVLARLDGTLTGPADEARLDVEYQQRYRVEIVEGLDSLDVVLDGSPEVLDVDCRERIGMNLTWVQPLPEPAPPET